MSVISRKSFRFFVAASLIGILAACAAPGEKQVITPQSEAPADKQEAATAEPAGRVQSLSGELLFDMLMGEIAGQRGRLDISAPHYLQAALEADDPRVAERAVQIAMFGKQFKVARRAAQRLIELDSSNLEAHKILTVLALRFGETDEAVTQLDYLVSISGTPQDGFMLATSVLSAYADKQVALDAMALFAERHADSVHAHLGLARIAVAAEQPDRALAAVEQALQLEPGMHQAVIFKAQILIRQEKKSAALEVLAQAVKDNKDDPALHFAYARVLLDNGDTRAAMDHFHTVVELSPDNADALFALALLEMDNKRWDAGEGYLKQVLALGKKQQDVYFYLGYAAQGKDDNERALEWFRKVESGDLWMQAQLHTTDILLKQGKLETLRHQMQLLRLENPDSAVQLYLIEAQALANTQRFDEAFSLYDEALGSFPENEDLLYARALTAEKTDRLDLAERDMRLILARDPENVRTLNALGYTLADRTDRYDEALEFIMRAYQQEPDDPAIIDSMGWIHYRLGRLVEAERYLRQAWDMTGNGEIGAHLGEVLWMRGERDEARRIWEKSREDSPDDPVLREIMDRFMP